MLTTSVQGTSLRAYIFVIQHKPIKHRFVGHIGHLGFCFGRKREQEVQENEGLNEDMSPESGVVDLEQRISNMAQDQWEDTNFEIEQVSTC